MASDSGVAVQNNWGPDGRFSVALSAASLRRAIERGGIVHVCSHFSPDAADARLSSIVAADGTSFTLGELLPCVSDRQLELVVMSACESGISGDAIDAAGRDVSRIWREVFGAQSTVTTIWRVRDEAAARVSIAFYKNLFAGSSRARSLALAQLEIAQSEQESLTSGQERFMSFKGGCEGDDVAPLPRADQDPRHFRNWAGFRLTGATGELYPPASPRL
jgi:CHAT domain-containing protein